MDLEILDRLKAWIETLPDRSKGGWIFPTQRLLNPLRPDNVLRRTIYPRLEALGLDWINFAVLWRSHSTLHQERGTDPKIIADQQGHWSGCSLGGVRGFVARSYAGGGLGALVRL